RTGQLTKRGSRVRLQDQPFQVLAALLEKPGELVTREELRSRIWPKTVVDFDHGLNKAISKIRDALGDSGDNPRFVETVARRGYRFLAEVAPVEGGSALLEPVTAQAASSGAGGASESVKQPRTLRVAALAGIALAVALAWFLNVRTHSGPHIRSLA